MEDEEDVWIKKKKDLWRSNANVVVYVLQLSTGDKEGECKGHLKHGTDTRAEI